MTTNTRSTRKTYCGVIVPMITPLNNDDTLDEPAIRRVIDHLIGGGVHGIFILSTIGESPSMSREMRNRLVHQVLDHVGGRVQVYVGVYDTVVAETLDMSRDFLRRGASAVVAQLPAYYRLSPDGQFRFLSTLVERIPGPFFLYDIPAIVHMSIDPGVIEHLRAFTNLVGVIDSSGDKHRLLELLESYADDMRFSVLVGNTAQAAFAFEHGADGFVPSVSNINPSLCVRLYQAGQKGDTALAATLQGEIDALHAGYAVEGYVSQTIARLKKRAAEMGLCTPKVLPPLHQEE